MRFMTVRLADAVDVPTRIEEAAVQRARREEEAKRRAAEAAPSGWTTTTTASRAASRAARRPAMRPLPRPLPRTLPRPPPRAVPPSPPRPPPSPTRRRPPPSPPAPAAEPDAARGRTHPQQRLTFARGNHAGHLEARGRSPGRRGRHREGEARVWSELPHPAAASAIPRDRGQRAAGRSTSSAWPRRFRRKNLSGGEGGCRPSSRARPCRFPPGDGRGRQAVRLGHQPRHRRGAGGLRGIEVDRRQIRAVGSHQEHRAVHRPDPPAPRGDGERSGCTSSAPDSAEPRG